jgi:PAP2 superfamily protein/glycosyl transferase family 87
VTPETSAEQAGSVRRLGAGGGVALAGLWLVVGALVLRQTLDAARPAGLFAWWRDSGSLYGGSEPFTGPPFAGLVLRPFARAAEHQLGLVWTFGTLLLVAAVGVVAVRALPGPLSRRTALFGLPLALILLVVSIPVRGAFTTGQTSVLPVLLVLLGWLMQRREERRGGGVLIGLAAALQPAVLLFAVLLWLAGRRAAAVAGAVTFAAGTAVAWAAMPGDSWTYWVRHAAGLTVAQHAAAGQSLHGVLLRLGAHGPFALLLFAVPAAAVCVVALRRAVRYADDGQVLLAAAVTGCAVVAAAPASWQHQQLWILLAAVGRVGSRRADRLVWPVFVVLVMSLDGSVLLPEVRALQAVANDIPLVAALLAACAVPFLSRRDALWAKPLPSGPLSRPNVMLELLLIRVGFWIYSYVRGLAPDERGTAEGHGRMVFAVESALRIDIEHWLNQLTAHTGWLRAVCDVYYQTFHYLVPVTLLAVLFWRRPAEYRRVRTALSWTTLLALIGFWLFPLAPPRLMPGLGFIDTAHGPQNLAHPDYGPLTALSNQYAAMPSLHVGWALWCAVVVIRMTPNLWVRALGVLYPLCTTFVVIGTANHYVLDAVGGVIVVAAGFGIQRTFFSRTGEAAQAKPDADGVPAQSRAPDPVAAGEADADAAAPAAKTG